MLLFPVRHGVLQERGGHLRHRRVRLPLAVLRRHRLTHAGLLRTLRPVLHPSLPRQELQAKEELTEL